MLDEINLFFDNFLSKIKRIPKTILSLNYTEKLLFSILFLIFLTSSIFLYKEINKIFLVEIPAYGGSFSEGVTGSPRFINPILATSKTDQDLNALIYSGLLKQSPSGKLIPELAEEYNISEDGRVYTFKLKDDLKFHDGKEITSADVEFTIKLTQNNIIKSPKRANWDGVVVEKINDKEIQFTLPQAYSPFLETLSIGILPKHIWEKISPEEFAFSKFNIEPIGSGPYQIKKIKRNSAGILESYTLKSFKDYSLGRPYINEVVIKIYPNEEDLIDAYNKNSFDQMSSLSPTHIKDIKMSSDSEILSTPLPRIFALFLNQNENSVFINKEIREALDKSVNKKEIVSEVLKGYGTIIDSPIPSNSEYHTAKAKEETGLDVARELLSKNGWKTNEDGFLQKETQKTKQLFSFSISTANIPELKKTAELLKKRWEELGAQVNLKIYEIGDLNQNVIRPRDYKSLLFGNVVGYNMDLYAFWHSSQRNDPGLNISMYANITSDALLEKTRTTQNNEEKKESLANLQKEIYKDRPAIFLYSPDFIYITTNKIKNKIINQINIPAERFLDINNWYIKTDKVWKIFL